MPTPQELAALLQQLQQMSRGSPDVGGGYSAGGRFVMGQSPGPQPVGPPPTMLGMGGGLGAAAAAGGAAAAPVVEGGVSIPVGQAAKIAWPAVGTLTGLSPEAAAQYQKFASSLGGMAGVKGMPTVEAVTKELGPKAAKAWGAVRVQMGIDEPGTGAKIGKFVKSPWLLMTIGLLAVQNAIGQWMDYEQSKKLPELGRARGRAEGLMAAGSGGQEAIATQRLGKETSMNMQAFQQAMQTLVPAAMSLPREKLEAVLGGGGGADFRIPLE